VDGGVLASLDLEKIPVSKEAWVFKGLRLDERLRRYTFT
jgi:hypothetical protein